MPGQYNSCVRSPAPYEPATFAIDPSPVSGLSEREVLLTLFDLGRQVASVIDFDELLQRIPELIGRLIQFDAFAVYLLDEKRSELRVAYAVGYPDTAASGCSCRRASSAASSPRNRRWCSATSAPIPATSKWCRAWRPPSPCR